ncbi:hypothetical protein [Staphylococcus saccharolyticus]|nr:hypothetical protein [Staphylococcus saccharolyticus]
MEHLALLVKIRLKLEERKLLQLHLLRAIPVLLGKTHLIKILPEIKMPR